MERDELSYFREDGSSKLFLCLNLSSKRTVMSLAHELFMINTRGHYLKFLILIKVQQQQKYTTLNTSSYKLCLLCSSIRRLLRCSLVNIHKLLHMYMHFWNSLYYGVHLYT